MGDIAVIGDEYFTLFFKFAGAEPHIVKNLSEGREKFAKLVKERKHKLIIISEDLARETTNIRENIIKEGKTYPICLIVPDFSGSKKFRLNEIRKWISEAMGIQIREIEGE